MEEMQPGQVFTPRGSDEPPVPNGVPNPGRGPTGPPEPTPSPVPTPEPVTAPAVVAAPVQTATVPAIDGPADWRFRQETAVVGAPQPPDEAITWTASEFIDNEKGPGWYAALIGGSVVVAILVYLLTKDKISTGIVLLVALMFANFAGHKPRTRADMVDNLMRRLRF
jgi:hypothetical protein